jgi:hypothetical protein
LQAYGQWIARLDTQQAENVQLALMRFQQSFHQQPAATCDTAFSLFDHFHTKVATYIGNIPRPNSIDLDQLAPAGPGVTSKPLSPLLIRIRDTLARNGLRVYEDEGMGFIGRDYSFMVKKFSGYVTPAMKEYLIQQAKEDKEGFQDDAELTVTPQQLAKRTVWWEQFAQDNPSFIYKQNALDFHASYLRVLLSGMDNTPVATDDNKLTDYYETAYDFIGKNYSQSQTNAIIAPYYKAWQKGDTVTIQKIKEKYSSN